MAGARFDCFVVIAEMRTGSNALAERLNLYDGITCHGELFNPAFVGHPNEEQAYGIDLATREADPFVLVDKVRAAPGLRGFRFFHNHDPRALDALLPDPRCAKILLSRDPLEAFVSRKIAEETGQWQLTDMRDRKQARIRFDPAEYEAVLSRHDAFRHRVRRALQSSGQTAFYIDHSEIGEIDVINGLAAFLGARERRDTLAIPLKRQNPEPVEAKVVNPEALPAGRLRRAGGAAPEPARGPNVRSWIAGARTPLLFKPLKGGATDRVAAWLAALDGVAPGALRRNLSRSDLRDWKKDNPEGRSFAIVSHPVPRAHRVFCRYILDVGPGSFALIRAALRERYGVPLPEGAPGPDWDAPAHRAAFLGFLDFARANNAGQTGLRSDPAWSSQEQLLAGAAQIEVPDLVLRESEMAEQLPLLAARVGGRALPGPVPTDDDGPIPIGAIYDATVENAVRNLHRRDYVGFGFGPWRGAGGGAGGEGTTE